MLLSDTAELCEHVITTLFNVQPARKPATVGRQGIDTPPHSPVLAASTSKDEAIPNLGEFIVSHSVAWVKTELRH